MIDLALKIVVLVSLVVIGYQDFKDRQVWFFLFPIFAICGAGLYYESSITTMYLLNITINLCLVALVLLVGYGVTRFILKKGFINASMGLGDVLFFIGFALSFPSISFLNFFVFSMVFSVLLVGIRTWLRTSEDRSVPLAGCMSLFLIGIYLSNWMGWYNSIYYL